MPLACLSSFREIAFTLLNMNPRDIEDVSIVFNLISTEQLAAVKDATDDLVSALNGTVSRDLKIESDISAAFALARNGRTTPSVINGMHKIADNAMDSAGTRVLVDKGISFAAVNTLFDELSVEPTQIAQIMRDQENNFHTNLRNAILEISVRFDNYVVAYIGPAMEGEAGVLLSGAVLPQVAGAISETVAGFSSAIGLVLVAHTSRLGTGITAPRNNGKEELRSELHETNRATGMAVRSLMGLCKYAIPRRTRASLSRNE